MNTTNFNPSRVAEDVRMRYADLTLGLLGYDVRNGEQRHIQYGFDSDGIYTVRTRLGDIRVSPESGFELQPDMVWLTRELSDIKIHIGLCYLIEQWYISLMTPLEDLQPSQAELEEDLRDMALVQWGDMLAEYLEDSDIIPHHS